MGTFFKAIGTSVLIGVVVGTGTYVGFLIADAIDNSFDPK